jgi:hypothetical protein
MHLMMRRRRFLTSALAGTLLAPYARFVRSGVAQAAPAAGRAFVAFYFPHNIRRSFFPQGTETDFTLHEMLSPLEPLRPHTNFFGPMVLKSGLAPKTYTNHTGMIHILTAWAGYRDGGALGPSVDQVIADHVGAATPVRSLNLCTLTDPPFLGEPSISFRGAKEKVSPEPSPHAAFKRMMVNTGGMASAEFDAVQKTRRSVLDNTMGELDGLRMRLAGEERRMMEAHLESLRTVERALFSVPGRTGGGACKSANLGADFDFRSPANYDKIVKLHIDVMVMALACDITRVGVLQLGNDHNERVTFNFIGVDKTHHLGIQHNATGPEYVAVTKWYVSQFAYLMNSLKAVPTPTGNLLTDSLLLYCNNMGSGHSIYNMPFLLGGNAGGRVKGNRLFAPGPYQGDVVDTTKALGHADLLLSICHAMGLEHLKHFGRPGAEFCSGPVPGLVS